MAFGMMMWSLTLIMAKPSSSPWRASVARLSGVASGPRVGSPKPNFIVVPPLISPLLSMPFVVIAQPISRAVVAVHRFRAIELGQDSTGELFAQFYTPLIEGINVPDHALGKDLVLIERDQATEGTRRNLRHQDAVAGPVPREELMGHQLLQCFTAQAGMREFLAHFVLGLALHQRFRLGEDIRQQNGVMLPDWIVGFNRGNEVARDEPGALVDQLIEGVLTIRAR